ncbi:hypothetical protein JOD57_000846 [Geodermatophilus bullaregiensis]|nr:hypothetical protein [Geodermatophilus bullaregiensis]
MTPPEPGPAALLTHRTGATGRSRRRCRGRPESVCGRADERRAPGPPSGADPRPHTVSLAYEEPVTPMHVATGRRRPVAAARPDGDHRRAAPRIRGAEGAFCCVPWSGPATPSAVATTDPQGCGRGSARPCLGAVAWPGSAPVSIRAWSALTSGGDQRGQTTRRQGRCDRGGSPATSQSSVRARGGMGPTVGSSNGPPNPGALMPQHPPSSPTYEGRRLPRPDEGVVDQGLGFDLGEHPGQSAPAAGPVGPRRCQHRAGRLQRRDERLRRCLGVLVGGCRRVGRDPR